MPKLDHAASLTSSDAASKQKATLQQRTTNRKSINTGYDALFLRRKVATSPPTWPVIPVIANICLFSPSNFPSHQMRKKAKALHESATETAWLNGNNLEREAKKEKKEKQLRALTLTGLLMEGVSQTCERFLT